MKRYSCYIFCLLATFLVCDAAFAQTENRDSIPVPVKKKRPQPIKKEYSLGLRLNTDGWSLFFDRGGLKNTDKTTDYFYSLNFWQIELSEKKHPQEIKRSNTIGSTVETSKPFIYGKTSNFYSFKIGYGKRRLIAGKPELKGEVERGIVSVHWVYMGGLSIGLEKPYYIEAFVPSGGTFQQQTIKYSDTTAVAFLTQENIVGSAGFGQGIGETKIVPGIHAKTGLHFDFANTKKAKLAIETGIALDVYSRAIEIMATDDSKPYFVNAYVAFQFGKRWAQKK